MGIYPEPFPAPIRPTVEALVGRVAAVQKQARDNAPGGRYGAGQAALQATPRGRAGFRPLARATSRLAAVTPFPFPAISPALPEIVLVCAAMALLMVGVFAAKARPGLSRGWRSSSCSSRSSCAACSGGSGSRFYGMFVTDAFAVFTKALVLLGAAVSIILALRFNEEHRIARFEFPVLILLASTGMMLMISANDLIALYLGLELQSLALYVVASFDRELGALDRGRAEVFRSWRACLGMLLYGASLIYGFAGTTEFVGLARLFAADPAPRRADHRHRFRHGRPRVQGVGGAVPYVDPRCLRRRANPGHRVFRGRGKDRGARAVRAIHDRAVRRFAGRMAAGHRVSFGRLDGSRRGRRDRAGNIKRLMAYSSIGHVGYPDRARRRDPSGILGVPSTWRSTCS